MAVVTVSRQLGSAGDLIAAAAAKQLGYELIDKDLITDVAKEANVPEEEVERFDEQATSPIKQFLHGLITPSKAVPVPPAMLWGLEYPYEVSASLLAEKNAVSEASHFLDHESYLNFLKAAVDRLAERDRVIIVGRGSQILLNGRPNVLHLRTVAPQEQRVETVCQRYEVGKSQAQDMIRASDRRRATYIRRNYDVEWSDATLYHVVINTGTVPDGVAASLIVHSVNALEDNEGA